jgi:hypothetical protein
MGSGQFSIIEVSLISSVFLAFFDVFEKWRVVLIFVVRRLVAPTKKN